MIDWHSHVLPQMDDGSRNVAESIALIEMQAQQGVDIVVATPHFYANDELVPAFLDRRREAFRKLKEELPEGAPEILLGAEVLYYPGISRMPGFKDLRVEGSNILLLEMPLCKWSGYMIRELVELSSMGGVKIVLAHIERYTRLQSPQVWTKLLNSGILMQVNASFFTSFGTKRKALTLLREGGIHFVGSDCHNLISRPPQIGKAFEIIQKKLGTDYVNQINEYGMSCLNKRSVMEGSKI